MFEGKRCYAAGMGYLENDGEPVNAENVQSTSLVIGGGGCNSYWNQLPEILCAGDNTNQVISLNLSFWSNQSFNY